MPNRLINETSPYLLQHAHNPVDWYAWGAEAFAKARADDKPLLVSIGYAACHWCHVMERESFEDESIAAQMNADFVCIKVDREERPDVDGIYMQAVTALHGRGGWPLNVFLLPDGRPFYGGTYFPNDDGRGMPSWQSVLRAVSSAYHDRREDVLGNAQMLTDQLQRSAAETAPTESLPHKVLDEAYHAMAATFDAENGGFGAAPKFPQSMPIEFLLRYHARTGEPHALHMVECSLTKMAAGGIYDHLGGGFARYSTDDRWLTPHFEKMLYDNAMLALAYTQAYQVTGRAAYGSVVEETLDYLMRDLRHADGGFFSSQDADSEGVEGKYYVWTPEELRTVLGAEGAVRVIRRYGVTEAGNFEGANILHLPDGTDAGAADDALDGLRAKLLAARTARVAPATDDKVLTAWNGLALRALAEAAAVLGIERYAEAAVRNADFLLRELRPAERLLRTWREGTAQLNGYLEDYASLINGLLSLHQTTFSHRWLHAAAELTEEMLDLFWDEEAQSLFDVGRDHEELIVRPRDLFDNATPSGSSMAAEALLRLATIAGDASYAKRAGTLLSAAALMGRVPMGFGNWLKTAELFFAEPMEIAIIGSPAQAATSELLRVVHGAYAPNRALIGLDPAESTPFASPILAGRMQVGAAPTAYVCRNYACDLPTTDPRVLAAQLTSPNAS